MGRQLKRKHKYKRKPIDDNNSSTPSRMSRAYNWVKKGTWIKPALLTTAAIGGAVLTNKYLKHRDLQRAKQNTWTKKFQRSFSSVQNTLKQLPRLQFSDFFKPDTFYTRFQKARTLNDKILLILNAYNHWNIYQKGLSYMLTMIIVERTQNRFPVLKKMLELLTQVFETHIDIPDTTKQQILSIFNSDVDQEKAIQSTDLIGLVTSTYDRLFSEQKEREKYAAENSLLKRMSRSIKETAESISRHQEGLFGIFKGIWNVSSQVMGNFWNVFLKTGKGLSTVLTGLKSYLMQLGWSSNILNSMTGGIQFLLPYLGPYGALIGTPILGAFKLMSTFKQAIGPQAQQTITGAIANSDEARAMAEAALNSTTQTITQGAGGILSGISAPVMASAIGAYQLAKAPEKIYNTLYYGDEFFKDPYPEITEINKNKSNSLLDYAMDQYTGKSKFERNQENIGKEGWIEGNVNQAVDYYTGKTQEERKKERNKEGWFGGWF